MSSTLTGDHKTTYETIFRHPISHNLEWRELIGMFKQLGTVEEETNGKTRFIRNGHTLSLHAHGKDVGAEEIMQIRHFLDASSNPQDEADLSGLDLIVVLDHSGAKIYSLLGDVTKPLHVAPFDDRGHDQQVHNPQGDSGGKQGPFRKLFYENLAQKLSGSRRILMVGDGLGASNEVDHFLTDLQHHRHEGLLKAIIGKESLDLGHLSGSELIAKAKEVFDSHPV